MSVRFAKVSAAMFVLLVASIVAAADNGALPNLISTLYSFPGGDKLGHFLLMETMSFLIYLSLGTPSPSLQLLKVVKATIVIVLLVTLEEISQLWFRTRTFSFWDLSSSYLGVYCGLTLALFARRTLQRRLASASVAHESPSTLA
jgi:VanZ family protein